MFPNLLCNLHNKNMFKSILSLMISYCAYNINICPVVSAKNIKFGNLRCRWYFIFPPKNKCFQIRNHDKLFYIYIFRIMSEQLLFFIVEISKFLEFAFWTYHKALAILLYIFKADITSYVDKAHITSSGKHIYHITQ